MMLNERDIARFWDKVDVGGLDECWNWTAGRISNGYGVFRIDGRNQYAHRTAWMISSGQDIPDGMMIRHKCDNKPCCNPAHLELGVSIDNVRDMHEKGRARKALGSENGRSKLTEEQVVEIERLLSCGFQHHVIGEKFGVARSTIAQISAGNNWAWLTGREKEE